MTIGLPQNLKDLSTIHKDTYPFDKWSGAVNIIHVENHIALMKRSDTMPSHKGQMGFFGGHKQAGENPIETALRETQEESLINPNDLNILGLSEPVYTSSKRLIIPLVSEYKKSIDEFFGQAKSNGEWSDLIIVRLDYLQDEKSWQYAQVYRESKLYPIYFCPLDASHCYTHHHNINSDFMLWGASAKMLWNYFKFQG